MDSNKFFNLNWSWYEESHDYLFYHPNKTESEFKKDVKKLFKKYGEEYLKYEESWAGAAEWTFFISDKLPELGYERVLPINFGHFGSYIIKGEEEEDEEFEKLIGKKLMKKAIKKNKDVEYKLSNGEQKFVAKKRFEQLDGENDDTFF